MTTPKTPSVAQVSQPAPFKPERLWDGRKMVPFQAIDNPPTVPAADASAFLKDDDYVIGVFQNGAARAYPTRFLWWHHVINDSVGGKPVAISYCSVCNTGVTFDATLAGNRVNLDFYGLYQGVACFVDRASGSVFTQVDARFVTGPLAGKTLAFGPVLDTTWGQWRELHPDTSVMTPKNAFEARYGPPGRVEPRGYDAFPAPFFRPTMGESGDLRLPPFQKVLAVTAGSWRRAYPIVSLEAEGGPLHDTLGETPLVILFDAKTATAAAFSREIDGKSLSFSRVGSVIRDRETGSAWNLAGACIDGPMKGKQLKAIDAHLSQWYGWSAYFPDTSIYGRSDPPKPGSPFGI